MRVGDEVLLRSIRDGRVRWCWPHHYVGAWGGRHGIYVQPGARGRLVPRASWSLDVAPAEHVWTDTHVLRFVREGCAHTIELFWDARWEFLYWYVNLQEPLSIRGTRFDTRDLSLDVVVSPDGAWSWKDEEDVAEALALGLYDEQLVARVRAEGERVIAEQPWPTGWEDWRPPAAWAPLALPEDWDVV